MYCSYFIMHVFAFPRMISCQLTNIPDNIILFMRFYKNIYIYSWAKYTRKQKSQNYFTTHMEDSQNISKNREWYDFLWKIRPYGVDYIIQKYNYCFVADMLTGMTSFSWIIYTFYVYSVLNMPNPRLSQYILYFRISKIFQIIKHFVYNLIKYENARNIGHTIITHWISVSRFYNNILNYMVMILQAPISIKTPPPFRQFYPEWNIIVL